MTKREVLRKFCTFLKKEGVLEAFVRNYREQRCPTIKSPKKVLVTCILRHTERTSQDPLVTERMREGYRIIDYSLHWASTPEGDRFWGNVNDKWNRLISQP